MKIKKQLFLLLLVVVFSLMFMPLAVQADPHEAAMRDPSTMDDGGGQNMKHPDNTPLENSLIDQGILKMGPDGRPLREENTPANQGSSGAGNPAGGSGTSTSGRQSGSSGIDDSAFRPKPVLQGNHPIPEQEPKIVFPKFEPEPDVGLNIQIRQDNSEAENILIQQGWLVPDSSGRPMQPSQAPNLDQVIDNTQQQVGSTGDNWIQDLKQTPEWNNIAPRISFTYDITGDGTNVIKGNYAQYGVPFGSPGTLNLDSNYFDAGGLGGTHEIRFGPDYMFPFADLDNGVDLELYKPEGSRAQTFLFPHLLEQSGIIGDPERLTPNCGQSVFQDFPPVDPCEPIQIIIIEPSTGQIQESTQQSSAPAAPAPGCPYCGHNPCTC